ncbi:MAG: glycosyltransferase, partial [Acidimicrobiia bacterium]|nr:glycosyltransferase [Acidimicrobiia bacterium]
MARTKDGAATRPERRRKRNAGPGGRRRQWGADSRRALPAVAPAPTRRALSSARVAIFVTVAAWVAFSADQVGRLVDSGLGPRFVVDASIYVAIVTLLTLSAGAHLIARLGALYRARDHERVPRAVIDDHFAVPMPALTVLVPSYREDVRVIRQTLLSAALQEYAPLRIVLLVDDRPNPTDPEHVRMLVDARELPGELERLLAEPHGRFEAARQAFEAKARACGEVQVVDMLELASLYREAAGWLVELGEGQERVDNSDDFLVDSVLGKLAEDFESVAQALQAAMHDGARLSTRRMGQLHRRLSATFQAELTSFERKSYASLSHELNKAMNLNSYLGLMGGRYRVQQSPQGRVLLAVGTGPCDLAIPDTPYVLTLDADSTLLPEYCLRLVHFLEQPENASVAVAQTPYSAYPGARTRIERISGATTDLQHIVHQGLTRHGATFWVGANAVLRKRALDDIVELEDRAGFTIKRYIQDRTVIEDTESSIGHPGQRLGAVQLPRAAELQRHPAGLRVALHPAAAVGQRRARDPAQTRQAARRPAPPGQPVPHPRGLPAGQLPRLHLLGERRPHRPAGVPLQRPPAQPVRPAHRSSVLRGHGDGPAEVRLPAPRRPARLRLQPVAPARQRLGRGQVDRPGHRRPEDRLRPHAEGAQPHRRPVGLRLLPLRHRRLLALHGVARPQPRPRGPRPVRHGERRARLLCHRRLRRPAAFRGRR